MSGKYLQSSYFKKGLNFSIHADKKKEYKHELEDIAAIWLARKRDQKFACSERRAGGSEGDVSSGGHICGLPLERESESRFKNGESVPLEVGSARTSLKNRAGLGEGEEGGDRGSD